MRKEVKKAKVTPWEVTGEIDYSRLTKEFGIQPLKALPKAFTENILFRRGVIFAHRDIQRILEAIKNKKPFVMMTGLVPTGKFHIGHMLIAQQMVFWQKLGAKIYITVADLEAYNVRGQSLEQSKKIALEEYIPNYIAAGLKPKNCEIYFQSDRSKTGKKASAYYRLQNLLANHATFNEFRAVYGDISPGKISASLLQAADMLHPQLKEFEGPLPVVIPVGVDQDPHLRIARDMSKRIKVYPFIQLSSTYNRFMPALDGGQKMSASRPNSFIALTDSPEIIKDKVLKHAFSGGRETLAEHRKLGGRPEIDVSYKWLEMFFEQDDKKLSKIYKDYKSGKMLTSELKKYLIGKLTSFVDKHQKALKTAKKDIPKYFKA